MYLAIFILIFLAFLQGIVSFSLIKNGKIAILIVIAVACCGFVLAPFAVNFTLKQVVTFLNSLNVVQTICSFQVIEALVGILLTVQLTRYFYGEIKGWKMFLGFLSLAPPCMLIAGLFIIQIGAVSTINGYSYALVLIAVTILLSLFFYLIIRGTRILFNSNEMLIELKLLLYFLQILAAMFIPVAIIGEVPAGVNQQFDVVSTIVTMSVVVLTAATGYFFRVKRRKVF